MTHDDAFLLYRGKCLAYATAAVEADPTLTLVRGHYDCPLWGLQAHWWTTRPDGTISDPTAAQFPSGGLGDYLPFDGMITCDDCGTRVPEAQATMLGNGHYAVCSYACALHFVGL
jgi:hypothetical protein